ncbi:MAG TPA: hypothetical protein VEU96_13135 [Bryobacteraceae bacterium]|nr:hypothetical protein [Bryobacteraceae bacterium]
MAKKEKAVDTSAAESKIAASTDVVPAKPNTPKTEKKGKLLPKGKSRLPRRQKKAQRKKVGAKRT